LTASDRCRIVGGSGKMSNVPAPTENHATGPAASGSILVVDDDEPIRDAVARGLELHGYSVAGAPDAETATSMIARRRPDLLVLDIGLPGISGVELCRRLREVDVDVPILMLSARDQIGDRVDGLQAGADDYLVKPFALDELVARVQALLRRSRAATVASDGARAVGALWVDVDRRLATAHGNRLDLSRREFDLLAAFAANSGIVLSRIRLLELVWGYDFDVDTNVVDVFVGYLRRKLEAAGMPGVIETVRGVGFVLRVGG
jgi:two-component system, OmpR family, response regulator PrrA